MTTSARLRAVATASVALALGCALVLAVPTAASAHVTLDENTAKAGSYALLTFKVPTESESATTTSVTVQLPTDTPFVSVRTVPVPGWQAEIVVSELPEPVKIGDTTVTEAPTSIIWTAIGAGIGNGELGLFPFSVGPVPDVGHLELPVDQGYSDSSVVAWEGDEVPILYVNDEPPGDHAGEKPSAPGTDSTAVAGVVLGSGGLMLGAVALALTLIRRRPAA
ncbi:MAG TPA: YcnI family protein [Pseudolysinimonas sp.]|nr:YcnI family protein [Pseudolysinimonas sp.]